MLVCRQYRIHLKCWSRRTLWLIFIISIGKDFESANSTHCKVYNFIPSISACIGRSLYAFCPWVLFVQISLQFPSIWTLLCACSCTGGYFPQNAIWRGGVMLFVAQRIVGGLVGYHVFTQACANRAPCLNMLRLMVHWIEQASLVLLSAVSSNDYKPIHEV